MSYHLLLKILCGLLACGVFLAVGIRGMYLADQMRSAVNVTLPEERKYKPYGAGIYWGRLQNDYSRLYPDNNLIWRVRLCEVLLVAAFAFLAWMVLIEF